LTIIEERRANPRKDGGADLLSILLEDEAYTGQNEIIIDECITFFLAGSQTVKVTDANMLMHIAMREDVRKQVRQELREKVFKEQIERG